MSGPEAPKPDDQLLDEFLAGEGAVRAAYRDAAQQQAPEHLDAAILQAAQAAARPVPRVRRRWQTPMAAAAVVVLGFGVLLQVQRDPAVQQAVMAPLDRAAPAAAPAAIATLQDTAKAEVLAEAAPMREAADADQKKNVAEATKPKLAAPAEKRRAAPVDAVPPSSAPPPAPAMADAPSAVAAASAEPELAAMAADAAVQAGAVARESMPRQERFVAAAAPMAKASRAPITANLMTPPAAPAAVASDATVATVIERWAQSCGAEPVGLSAPMLWRGLAVASWTRQADGDRMQTTLRFAAEVTPEAIAASLGALAAKATLTTAQCAVPVTRELRQSNGGWMLVCECGKQ